MSKDLSTLLILGAVGVGAYVVVQRLQAARLGVNQAAPPVNTPLAQQAYRSNDASLWRQVGGILGNLVNPRSIADNQAAAAAVSGPGASGGYIGDEAVYVPDLAAVNVPSTIQSAFSYAQQTGNWLDF